MKRRATLLAGVLLIIFSVPIQAQSTLDDCAQARDPVRCEARQAALQACADQHGAFKRACLEAAMPPVDCEKSKSPRKCEAAQKAKEICKSKTDKAQRQCLRDQSPKKKAKKKAKKKVKQKQRR